MDETIDYDFDRWMSVISHHVNAIRIPFIEPKYKMASAAALGKLNAIETVTTMEDILLSNEDWHSRLAAAEVLYLLSEPRLSTSRLLQLMIYEKRWEVKRAIARIFRCSNDERVRKWLLQIIEIDPKEDNRRAAAVAMARPNDKESIEKLIELAKKEDSDIVLSELLYTLAIKKNKRVMEFLEEAELSDNSRVQRCVDLARNLMKIEGKSFQEWIEEEEK